MILFPNCKINLGLRVLSRRNDGYHDLETVMYPVPLKDAAEIVPLSAFPAGNQTASCEFVSTGIAIPGEASGNLCLKAWELLKKDFPRIPGIRMHLHKTIPIGAGLGGGSSDGAFTLLLLNQEFQLGLSTAQLLEYAARLGSDCPFFIINKPCFATGRGELLEPIGLDLSAYSIALVDPGIHISTAWAFSRLHPSPVAKSVKTIIRQPVETWKAELINDFELPVFSDYPQLKTIKENMYAAGAVYATMTGSGATIAGLFRSRPSGLPGIAPDYRLIIL